MDRALYLMLIIIIIYSIFYCNCIKTCINSNNMRKSLSKKRKLKQIRILRLYQYWLMYECDWQLRGGARGIASNFGTPTKQLSRSPFLLKWQKNMCKTPFSFLIGSNPWVPALLGLQPWVGILIHATTQKFIKPQLQQVMAHHPKHLVFIQATCLHCHWLHILHTCISLCAF